MDYYGRRTKKRKKSKPPPPTTSDDQRVAPIQSTPCATCRKLEPLIQARLKDHLSPKKTIELWSDVALLKSSACGGCPSCRWVYRALHLPAITGTKTWNLSREALVGRPIYASVEETMGEKESSCWYTGQLAITLMAELEDGQQLRGFPRLVLINPTSTSVYIKPLDVAMGPDPSAAFEAARSWIKTCRDEHICGNLKYSEANPTLLLEIKSDDETELEGRLVSLPGKLVEYVAISYRWAAETDGLPQGTSTRTNITAREGQDFRLCNLPRALQDAVLIVTKLGFQYVWIDAVCIVQDDSIHRDQELERMHEYYGNAFLTLCANSCPSATQSLLVDRIAWSLPTRSCRLAGMKVDIENITFDQWFSYIREKSPLADRAWTLQEELLSPRILCWTDYGVSWSCSEMKCQEGYSQVVVRREAATSAALEPQEFLMQCSRVNARTAMHRSWNQIIKAYSRRFLSDGSDRLPALSGLAARYYDATSVTLRANDLKEQFLAGLWKRTIAEDLLWSVVKAASTTNPGIPDHRRHRNSYSPSWSWTILPIGTPVAEFEHVTYHRATEFRLEEAVIDLMISNQPFGKIKFASLRLRGRVRAIPVPSSQSTQWAEPRRRGYINPSVGSSTHSIDAGSGRIVLWESGIRQPFVGQLDFLPTSYSRFKGWAFEVMPGAALVLSKDDRTGIFTRLGCSWNVHDGFFASSDCDTISLY